MQALEQDKEGDNKTKKTNTTKNETKKPQACTRRDLFIFLVLLLDSLLRNTHTHTHTHTHTRTHARARASTKHRGNNNKEETTTKCSKHAG